MVVNLDNLDKVTQEKYAEFQESVEKKLQQYREENPDRFDLIERKMKDTDKNWDASIDLVSQGKTESVDVSRLLVYEYFLAVERITKGKVSFEAMADRFFGMIQKFRIGNPIKGLDDECLYGKDFDDETAIPVTTKKYRVATRAGAQHLDYFKDGKLSSAVFLYEKGVIRDFAKDEKGKTVDFPTDGIDFTDLSKGQSLLTNLRQTAFHEWTHSSEKDFVSPLNNPIDYEYRSIDGKIYRNYDKISSYVTTEGVGAIEEPEYTISKQRDYNGNREITFVDRKGKRKPISDFQFKLNKRKLEKELSISTGMTTKEVLPNGEIKIHNIITEGFVEATARAMVRAVDPEVKDLDEEKYPEYVEMATQVITSRDESLDEGQTFADFLTHSSVLKKDLESRTVTLSYGKKVDGLHYLSDYADMVQSGNTRRRLFYRSIPKIFGILKLSKTEIEKLKTSQIFHRSELNKEEQAYLKDLLAGGNPDNEGYAQTVVNFYNGILIEENKFFNGIGEKLGYKKRTNEEQGFMTQSEKGGLDEK